MNERIRQRCIRVLPSSQRRRASVALACLLLPCSSIAATTTRTDYSLSQDINSVSFSEIVIQATIDKPGSDPTLFPDDGTSVDGGIAISIADVGTTIYADPKSQEFSNFAGYLMNGSDDTLGVLAGPALPHTANLGLFLESRAFADAGLTPDFAGLTIESIGIEINDLVFEPFGLGGTSFFLSATLIVLAIPEPSTGIDIKPGSDSNPINPSGRGLVPVAILGSDTFDVEDVDETTLGFGPNGVLPAHDLTIPEAFDDHLGDENDDGFTDLVTHYRTQEIGFVVGDEEACISGELLDGTPFEGCDTVELFGTRGTRRSER